MKTSTLWRYFRSFLRFRFDLSDGQESAAETVDTIRRGIEFKGTNLWTLIFAVFVASAGLNINSTAVVIGAMLISPLMGPIVGVGLGVSINDFGLIKKAAYNLGVMVVFSLITSALYFLITPISEAQSELLSRTTPTIWDVIIAFFGGLAGVVGATRKEKGNVVAGVAIATALMPPLCTAGYGLATLQWRYFLGAFYLFFINAVFISYSTLLVVRILKFPKEQFMSKDVERRVQRNVFFVVLLTVLPSFYIAYNIVQQSLFNQRVQSFVKQEFDFNNTQLLKVEGDYDRKGCVIRMYAVGAPLDSTDINRLQSRLAAYGLDGTRLELRQGSQANQSVDVAALRTGILEDLYRRNEEALEQKDNQIKTLQSDLDRYHRLESDAASIAQELKALEPNVEQFSVNSNIYFDFKTKKNDTLPVAYIHLKRQVSASDQKRLFDWLKLRTKSDKMILIQQ